MAPQKGKQATKGAQQIVDENVSTLNFYRYMAFGATAIYFLATQFVFNAFSTGVLVLFFLTLIVYGLSYYLMLYIAKASYTETGQLLDSGIDLNMEGGLAEHVKDVIILTAGTELLSMISNYFWFLWLLAPIRGAWMLWRSVLAPWFFQEAPPDDQDDKKKKKMERKMKKARH